MIYLDNQSTTRCDPRVLDAMLPYFCEHYGNPASNHSLGWMADAAVSLARDQVAASLGANSNEIVFCSGATEANNMAIYGIGRAYAKRGTHLVVAATEHLSVLECAQRLEGEGWTVTVVPVHSDGLVEATELSRALRPDTVLVSIMLVNNEIGVVQDIAALSQLVHDYNKDIVFHCDAAQALGKCPIDIATLGVDVASFSAHKVYGPKGVGALWRRKRPRLAFQPILTGGGHEQGLRPGTLPVPNIVGFGKACQLLKTELEPDSQRIATLREQLLQGLMTIPGVSVNGSQTARIAENLNIAISGVSADTLLSSLGAVAISTGSACSSATSKPSHVLAAICTPEIARTSIRLGIGRFTTAEEIQQATVEITAAIQRIRGR